MKSFHKETFILFLQTEFCREREFSCQRAKRKFTCRFLGECSRKSTKSIRANERNASLLAGFSASAAENRQSQFVPTSEISSLLECFTASAAENRQSQFVPTSETQVYLQVSRRVQPKIDNEIVKFPYREIYPVSASGVL